MESSNALKKYCITKSYSFFFATIYLENLLIKSFYKCSIQTLQIKIVEKLYVNIYVKKYRTTVSKCLDLRQCETHFQCVSLAPPRGPLKLSLLHSIVFHIALRMLYAYSPSRNSNTIRISVFRDIIKMYKNQR